MAEPGRFLGGSRLKLDEEIQKFMLGLDEADERLRVWTERRLRRLTKIEKVNFQREESLNMTGLGI